jgi:hypothetical protein
VIGILHFQTLLNFFLMVSYYRELLWMINYDFNNQ